MTTDCCPWCHKPLAVRFSRPGIEKGWRYGRLLAIDDDDIEIAVVFGGGVHTIRREHVQMKTKGPRGGTKWEAL